ncbi:restriction endonuclease subunit S [Alloscardovia criceti]|uniref:restriction endonuclease subunit S n=1 Tax=Alloscardovia criceti TaxID=356828 RepID=UPI00037603DA|nr:restriction endonuclease subunit S [Alloscardovia criceti]
MGERTKSAFLIFGVGDALFVFLMRTFPFILGLKVCNHIISTILWGNAWEQRKADAIGEYSKGSGYSKNNLVKSGTPIILYGRLYTAYELAIDGVDTYVKAANNYDVYSTGNEVLVPASGETAEDIARASAVVKSGLLIGGDLNIIRPKSGVNPIFLALVLSTGTAQKELAKRAQGKSIVHLHNSDIKTTRLKVPRINEQIEIVNSVLTIDSLITLHQRKQIYLQILKKLSKNIFLGYSMKNSM